MTIGSNSAIGNNNTNLNTIYQRLSSGNRINSAADDAAGLAISEKISAQVAGLDRGTQNAQDMQGLLRTAEGGLSNINDALTRMRELGVQASNGIYTDSDRSLLQDEVSNLKSFIQDSAQGTEFNTMRLLDGSFANKHMASSPDGSGMTINLENASLETLGIEDFDVTQNIDLEAIDSALSAVNTARSKIGASINRIDHTVNSNEVSYENQVASLSRIADADMAKESTRLSAENLRTQYSLFMQKEQMSQNASVLNLLQ